MIGLDAPELALLLLEVSLLGLCWLLRLLGFLLHGVYHKYAIMRQ
jgi:hypothetical protein